MPNDKQMLEAELRSIEENIAAAKRRADQMNAEIAKLQQRKGVVEKLLKGMK